MDETSDDGKPSLQAFLQDIRSASELLARASRTLHDIGFKNPEKVQGALLLAAAKTSLVMVAATEDVRGRIAGSLPPGPDRR
jgi:hypothetical protein